MGSGPDEVEELRQQIDESRKNLGAAVGALAYKGDVKNRGKEALEDKKEVLMEKVEQVKGKLPDSDAIKDKLPTGEDVGAKADALKSKLPDGVGEAAGRIGDATPSKEEVKQKAQDAASAAGEHPVAVMAGAAVAGLAAGLALPETELERQKLAPAAQDARQQVQARARETAAQVKSAAQDAAASTVEAVREQGQQQGGKVADMADKAADKAQEKID